MKEPSRTISCMFPAPSRNTTTLDVYSDIAHKKKNHVYSDCKDNIISLMFIRKFKIIYAKGIALFEGSNQRVKLLLTKVQLKIELINQKFCSSALF
jgi:hypothetical protein